MNDRGIEKGLERDGLCIDSFRALGDHQLLGQGMLCLSIICYTGMM